MLTVVNTFANLKPQNFGIAMIFISVKVNILSILWEFIEAISITFQLK